MRTITRSTESILVALILSACGGSGGGNPTSPSQPTPATYSGAFATGTRSGTITLVAGSPATGSLNIAGSVVASLSGTYSASTSSFSMSGGGFTLAATVDANNQLSGTLTGSTAGTTGVVVGIAVASGKTNTTYCGTFSGTSAGTEDAVIVGSTVTALAVDTNGQGSVITGTVSGSTVTLSWKPLLSPGVYGVGTATGTISGSTISGTWSASQGEKGTFTASSAGC